MASSCTTLMSFNPGALWAQLMGSASDGMAVFEAFPGADAGHAPGRRLAGGPAAFEDVFHEKYALAVTCIILFF